MTQALRFNVATLIGLLLMFAGVWCVFGLAPALIALGGLVWFTALYCLLLSRMKGS